ncbi:EF-P 5-aminopentanol modification-associated protein YfmH [Terrilactibacillus laevilacticus]|uniref:EF-P 5-aminopentanol modification-associated protein YfmH n=1 Tax=Terrilactibacillus laevilacticus TaxID=1380157 RepID=UPI0011474473|nr:pitrilysin family protein [Terrilactibacillus laevilacticus]
MKKQYFSQLDETIFFHTLDNGLKVYMLPKQSNKTFATFTTQYGSIDNTFKPLNQEQVVTVPDGIAHFLEHKMFEKPDGTDVFYDFGEQGASANAFTSFNRTAYLFSSTSNVDKNLNTLIDFVQTPAWTDESVEKEKGIIGQEIRMYDDNPDWRLFFGLIENMYHHHPIKIDIAGTVESISHITKDLLLDCYHTFYHPSNMILFVTGPIDPEHIIHLVEDNQGKKDYTNKKAIEHVFPDEPRRVAKSESILHMAVQTPKCLIGFKEPKPYRSGKELMKHEIAVNLLLELMFGRGTERYRTLIDDGLIDESFSFEYTEEYGFGFSAIGGNTEQPEQLKQKLREMVINFKNETIDTKSFDNARRKRMGSILRSLNSLDYIANQFTRYKFNQMDLFELIPELEKLTIEDLKQTLHEHFSEEGFTSCTVLKK